MISKVKEFESSTIPKNNWILYALGTRGCFSGAKAAGAVRLRFGNACSSTILIQIFLSCHII
jgi:hypothetical protein